ncbi:MAG: hypothetical protein HYX49_12915 [Chloroflexi bacterium]|nr:hypothetical protein [Chloroflexota bacterium]
MNYLVIVLRLIHILAGMFWVGGSILFKFFIGPTVAATGETGQKFMAHMVTKAKITAHITAAAILNVLAGGWLYWLDAQGFTSAWWKSSTGIGFGVGGLLGLVGWVFGIMVGVNTAKLGTLASQIQGKPSSEQMSQIQAAQKQLAYASPISAYALILALIFMATARYWSF